MSVFIAVPKTVPGGGFVVATFLLGSPSSSFGSMFIWLSVSSVAIVPRSFDSFSPGSADWK